MGRRMQSKARAQKVGIGPIKIEKNLGDIVILLYTGRYGIVILFPPMGIASTDCRRQTPSKERYSVFPSKLVSKVDPLSTAGGANEKARLKTLDSSSLVGQKRCPSRWLPVLHVHSIMPIACDQGEDISSGMLKGTSSIWKGHSVWHFELLACFALRKSANAHEEIYSDRHVNLHSKIASSLTVLALLL